MLISTVPDKYSLILLNGPKNSPDRRHDKVPNPEREKATSPRKGVGFWRTQAMDELRPVEQQQGPSTRQSHVLKTLPTGEKILPDARESKKTVLLVRCSNEMKPSVESAPTKGGARQCYNMTSRFPSGTLSEV